MAETLTGAAQPPWDIEAFLGAPEVHPAPGFEGEGVRALFYEGLPWEGKPTRVFAWYGAPEAASRERLPAVVLVHGGGGTAFADWVRPWSSRGYAAIAMDTCGSTAGGEHGRRPRHEHGGPPGWGGFGQVDRPIEDQWMFHAVADVVLANSLLRSFPDVDPGRIGLTGISWGAVVACVVAGLDPRFRFVSPVYGCGSRQMSAGWADRRRELGLPVRAVARTQTGEEGAARWLELWDPSRYLPDARMPMLWVTGTNDFAFALDAFRASYRLPIGRRTLSVRVEMPHGQPEGQAPEEIRAFADSVAKGATPLAEVTGNGVEGGEAWVAFSSGRPVVRAELNFTEDDGPWQDRRWRTAPAGTDAAAGRASAPLPAGTTACFFNLIDDRGLIVSSEHESLAQRPRAT
jgi:dienelactone hydrolase